MYNKIENDLKNALKNKDSFRLSVLRMLKSALQLEKINLKKDLSDEEVLTVIRKQVKIRNASKEDYIKYNRLDLANNLEKEIEILKTYLPAEMTDEDLIKEIDNILNNMDNPTFGLAMKEISRKLAGRADMGKVNKILKEKISG